MKRRVVYNGAMLVAMFWIFVLSVTSAQAEERIFDGVILNGKFIQGGLVIGQLSPSVKRVLWQKKVLPVSAEHRIVLGFGRDEKPSQQLILQLVSGEEHSVPIVIEKRSYEIQRIEGVPARTVNPDPKHMARIGKESGAVVSARNTDSQLQGFLQTFIWPVKGPITGVYGSQRYFNGEPRRPHFGLDIAAPKGEEIKAPADGVVTMAYHDMFFSGDTMIIDHGFGVNTSYLHMSKMLVQEGDQVKQGQVIGLVGASGRATGPHLCWRLNWYQTRLDPQLLVPEAQ